MAFADDLAIMSHGKTPTETEAYANSDLVRIGKWAKDNKLRFNETKSKAMMISKYRSNITSCIPQQPKTGPSDRNEVLRDIFRLPPKI
jgi:hypothetical protein